MVFAKGVVRQEACEPTDDSSSRQRRISLFRTASLRSQTVSASSLSSSSPSTSSSSKVSSPHLLSCRSARPPLSVHQNSKLRRQTSLRALTHGAGAGKSSLPSMLPVKSGRTSLGPRVEARVDEFGVVAAVAFPESREKAATASSTLPLFSRRHSGSRPPSCTASTSSASSSAIKTMIKQNCIAEAGRIHHSRLSSTSSTNVAATKSSKGPTRQTPKVKTKIIEGKDTNDTNDPSSSFHLPIIQNAEGGSSNGNTASRSPHTPTPTTTQGKLKTTSNTVPWARWDGQRDHHRQDGGSVDEQQDIESSTGLDLLDITIGSQLLQEGDELEEMLKAEIDVLGIMDQTSSTVVKSSPPRDSFPTGSNSKTVSNSVPMKNFTALQQKMDIIMLERDDAIRQWKDSQEEMCRIQTRLAQLEAAAADEQEVKRAEKAASDLHRHSAQSGNATSQTDAMNYDDVVDSADDTLHGTLRLCRVELVRDGWRQAAQMANHQREVLEMQMSVTGYLMDQLCQLERSLLSSASSSLLHSTDEASRA